MKAAVLNDYAQPMRIEDVTIDPPRAGEVQVRIGATGVCHSDYHVIDGEWKYGLPIILGHEAAGVVEAVGPNVIGNGRTVEQAIEMTRAAGTACIVGMAPQGSRATFDPLLLVQKETRLIGTWYGSARPRIDFPRMVELTLAGKLKVEELISRRYTLDQINEGFERLGRGEVARGVSSFSRVRGATCETQH